MRAIIEIDMSNAAFEDSPAGELASILENLAAFLSVLTIRTHRAGAYEPVALQDTNGNRCGTFRLEE